MAHIHMTSEELSAARKAFGLTGAEFARVFDVSERTVRGWEIGHRDLKRSEGKPVVVPRPIAVLVRLALKHASVRRELGIPSKGETPQTKPHRVASGPHSGPHSG
jgi:transcriptional regulator with XRE-family HTH domain